jgi:hypothetical protein
MNDLLKNISNLKPSEVAWAYNPSYLEADPGPWFKANLGKKFEIHRPPSQPLPGHGGEHLLSHLHREAQIG